MLYANQLRVVVGQFRLYLMLHSLQINTSYLNFDYTRRSYTKTCNAFRETSSRLLTPEAISSLIMYTDPVFQKALRVLLPSLT